MCADLKLTHNGGLIMPAITIADEIVSNHSQEEFTKFLASAESYSVDDDLPDDAEEEGFEWFVFEDNSSIKFDLEAKMYKIYRA